jgi:serine/threonine-protein kinase
VHRDVTPANVMLTGAGAKVVDFGSSALIGQTDAAPDGSLLGTPAYLAPERLGGGQVSPPADVYALGLLLYRMLTGRFPWPAGNTTEALRAHLYADPAPVPALPGLPPEVAELCLRSLAKQPEDRPTAAEAAEVLCALVGLQPIITPSVGFRPSPHPYPPPAVATGPRPRTGRRIGRALRFGGPKPLGGGLFRGGGLARDLFAGGRLGEAVLAGRHRLQAGVATLILAATIGLVWSSTREPVDVGPAQAAAAGTAAGAIVPHGSGCKVRYRVKHDSGADFGAQVTIVNTGEHVLSEWRLEFAFAGGQRLTESPKRLTQKGRKLVLRAKNGTELRPGRSATVTLSGSYRVNNPLPLVFALNGHQCQAEVLGAVVVPSPPPPSPSVEKAEPTRRAETPATKSPTPKKTRTKAAEPQPGFAVTV